MGESEIYLLVKIKCNYFSSLSLIRRALVKKLDARLRARRGLYFPKIIVCGTGYPGFDQFNDDNFGLHLYGLRKELVKLLNQNEFLSIMFENDFNLNVPGVEEIEICKYPEVDLVVVFSHSPSAISEYTSFLEYPVIRTKLVILVPARYHPFYNTKPGYLSSVFWRVLVEGGQVLPYDPSGKTALWESVKMYFLTYRSIRSKTHAE